ncbi:MAG TPA: BadF/BadG/BcrA/BcrD ATPase family protein [Microlunatus sp.]
MPTADQFVVAIDAGGTHTRVGCFALDGTLLGRADGPGGGPNHNHRAAEHVSETIAAALTTGNLKADAAAAMTCGIAGYEFDQPNKWADDFFDDTALDCPRQLVNDAVIAHRGALAGEAGIIVVAGTGSMIMAITADGRPIESGRFQHYAGGARHLVYDLIHRILIGQGSAADQKMIKDVLTWWGVDDLDGLRTALLELSDQEYNQVKHRYGALAPTVTAAAEHSPLADTAVRDLATKTAIGVLVLAPLTDGSPVPVALSGALATAPEFARRFTEALSDLAPAPDGSEPTGIEVIVPVLEPLGGAALMALESVGVAAGPAVLKRLQLAQNS